MRHSQTAVIVVAAGSGERLGAGVPKAFAVLGGRSILQHALEAVQQFEPRQLIIVVPRGVDGAEADLNGRIACSLVPGGATRQESVAAGLAVLDELIDTVLIHDAARPFTPIEQFERVFSAVQPGVGVVPALPVVDSLKRVQGETVIDAVDRADLVAVQTPQGFHRQDIVGLYRDAVGDFTDDAALFAENGGEIVWVRGSEEAFKITTPADFERARSIVSGSAAQPRIGIGTDVHAFGGEGNLWLAGLEWPGESALSGHSDGDVVAHAIVDALLGAAGLGDIGTHFGTDASEFAGAHASAFLIRTAELVNAAGFAIGNVSAQFQGNRPKFAPRRVEAETVLSQAIGAPVSLSATTTDGLGFTGAGEGIAAYATAILYPRSSRSGQPNDRVPPPNTVATLT